MSKKQIDSGVADLDDIERSMDEDSGSTAVFRSRKPAKCPVCGSRRMAVIVWGYPTEETQEKYRRGEVVLGGCCVTQLDPNWACVDCESVVYSSTKRQRYEELERNGWRFDEDDVGSGGQ